MNVSSNIEDRLHSSSFDEEIFRSRVGKEREIGKGRGARREEGEREEGLERECLGICPFFLFATALFKKGATWQSYLL